MENRLQMILGGRGVGDSITFRHSDATRQEKHRRGPCLMIARVTSNTLADVLVMVPPRRLLGGGVYQARSPPMSTLVLSGGWVRVRGFTAAAGWTQ